MILYYSSFVCALGVVFVLAYIAIRHLRPSLLTSLLPNLNRSDRSSYLPLPTTFSSQVRSGFTSSLFDVRGENLNEGDEARRGLDEEGLREVREIMLTKAVTFDEARLIRQERIFARNGIDPKTGMPLDKKAITRLS